MLDFAEVLDTPRIFSAFVHRALEIRCLEEGGGLRLFALCNFNFQIWREFETWPTDNLL